MAKCLDGVSFRCIACQGAMARKRSPDFSVVLFRSDFVLVSEKNHMKVHTNQWIGTMSYPPERLAGVTSRGQTMAPGGAESFAVT